MLVLVLVLLAAECGVAEGAGRSPLEHHSIHDHWEAFKARHGKTYGSPHEEQQRRTIRSTRLDTIRAHNREAMAGKFTFTLKENHLIDLTSEEYRKLFGYRYNERERRSQRRPDRRSTVEATLPPAPTYYNSTSVGNLPTCVNWTANGWVGPVKKQGKCGSCWSLSAVGSIQAQYFNRTGNFVDLSEQNLIDCTSPQGNKGCYGGNMQNAFWYVQTLGIEPLKTYPYTSGATGSADSECKFDVTRSVTNISGWYNVDINNEVALQQAVAMVGPISAALDTTSVEFQTYGGGIYQSSTCGNSVRDIVHAVLIVGYGVYKGQPYWLIQNTWGTEWGMNGYMMLARNANNMCGIATDATFPIIDAPKKVSQPLYHQCPPFDAVFSLSSSSSRSSPENLPRIISVGLVIVVQFLIFAYSDFRRAVPQTF